MNKAIKITISIIIILLSATAIYLGSFAPYKKSQLYISVLREQRAGTTISSQDLIEDFDRALSFYSPVGNEEMVKFYSTFITGLIKNKVVSEEEAVMFTEHIEKYAFEDYLFHDLFMAQVYDNLFRLTEDPEHIRKAEEYLISAHEIAPTLPQPLEGLMIMYITTKETEKLKEVANKILEIWPDHPVIKKN